MMTLRNNTVQWLKEGFCNGGLMDSVHVNVITEKLDLNEMRMSMYITCLFIVLELGHVSPTGLCYPLACH